MARHKGSVGKIGETFRLRIISEDGTTSRQISEIYFPNDGPGSTYLSRRRAEAPPDGWDSSATSAGSMPRATSISATGSPT
jgi:hypothetical protein